MLDETSVLLEMVVAETLAAEGLPSLTVVLVQGQETLWQHSSGYADIEAEVLATDRTIYRVGSITKLFTALAVMQLRDRGKLTLDSPASAVLPQLARFGAPAITFRHLLSHTSGLPTMPPLPALLETMARFPPSVEELASIEFPEVEDLRMEEIELLHRPGAQITYSNVGMALLGDAICRLSGLPYTEYIAENILRPLGMTCAGYRASRDVNTGCLAGQGAPASATGYLPIDAPPTPIPLQAEEIRAFLPAGGLRASAADMARFLAFLSADFAFGSTHCHQANQPKNQTELLSRSTLAEMYMPVLETEKSRYTDYPGPSGIGLGWHLASLGGLRVVEHGGADLSTAAFLAYLPERALGIFVASNSGANPMAVALLAYEILEMF